MDSEDKAEGLKHPKTEQTDSASAQAGGDQRFQNTAEIASQVVEKQGDEYGQKSRPPASTVNSSSSGVEARPTTLERMQARTDSEIGSSPTASGDIRSHVLLVEDNAINQRILKRKLESKKYKVTTANNGREAVNLVKSNLGDDEHSHACSADGFDVVLMDQEMPVLDGNAATREIRQLEQDGEILPVPILGVTANVREPQREEMRSAGMNDVMSKPYSMDDLMKRIDELVLASKGEQRSEASKKEADAG